MKAMLSQQDAAALDLLLDHSPTASGHAAPFDKLRTTPVFAPCDGVGRERVQYAQKVLNLLHLFPVGDPPGDLLSRTLRHVGESMDSNAHVGAAGILTHSAHPHA
jgi:hypothetical protein